MECQALIGLGHCNTTNTIQNYENALNIARKMKYRRLESSALIGLGYIWYIVNDNRVKYFLEALNIARETKYKKQECQALIGLGNTLVINQNRNYSEALNIAREIKE